VRKTLPPPVFELLSCDMAIHYTDFAIPAHTIFVSSVSSGLENNCKIAVNSEFQTFQY